ncbi:hypothetical protein GCM43_08755 [Janthinobacterium aquaticum]|nr:hypothetical protein GCM43_08755 [Janthinobacterium sp. FT58W]
MALVHGAALASGSKQPATALHRMRRSPGAPLSKCIGTPCSGDRAWRQKPCATQCCKLASAEVKCFSLTIVC